MSEYINAEAFRQDLYYSDDAVNMGGEYKGLWVRWRAIEAAIKKHKAEDVAPVIHAKWIIETWNNKEHYTCSNCQHVIDYEPCYHYCPMCGAKMDKE